MGRIADETARDEGRLRRAAKKVKGIFTRGKTADTTEARKAAPAPPEQAAVPKTARATRRETDIPFDVLDRTYTPALTSSKASFRSDGADHEQDQEFSAGTADPRWNDEDHYTNKSDDPRIGTRGRTYEANESRADTRDERR